jgi:hypothetical protein
MNTNYNSIKLNPSKPIILHPDYDTKMDIIRRYVHDRRLLEVSNVTLAETEDSYVALKIRPQCEGKIQFADWVLVDKSEITYNPNDWYENSRKYAMKFIIIEAYNIRRRK